MVLHAVVPEAARRFGDASVLVASEGWSVSFTELDRASDEVAAGLAQRGVGEADVVGLALPSSPEYVVAYIAAAKIGATTAGVNPRSAPGERDDLFELAGATLVLATEELAPGRVGGDVEIVAPATEDARQMLGELRVAGGTPPPLADDPSRPVAIVFTSGTTGRPKAAVFTGAQLAAITTVDIGDQWGMGGRMIAATSLAHVGFMTKLPWYLRLGGPTFLRHRWRASEVLDLVEREGITSVGGVPTQMALMLRDPSVRARDFSSVGSIVLGGGPATVGLLREASEVFGAPISLRFSSTETGGCGTGTAFDDPIDDTIGVGLPRGPITVAIRDDEGVAQATGEIGEVCVATPTAFARYHDDPVATQGAFTAHGEVRTGDLGYLDERGRLHLAGRAKDMYVRGGYNVYPAEVEAVLAEHPSVGAVAVVARPDEVMGEIGVAVIVPRGESAAPTIGDLRSFAADRLGAQKLPDEVRVVPDLPVTAMDKIDKVALRALVQDEVGS